MNNAYSNHGNAWELQLSLVMWVSLRIHAAKTPPTCNTTNSAQLPLINSANDFPFRNNLHLITLFRFLYNNPLTKMLLSLVLYSLIFHLLDDVCLLPSYAFRGSRHLWMLNTIFYFYHHDHPDSYCCCTFRRSHYLWRVNV